MAIVLIDDFERADGAVGGSWVNNSFGAGSNIAQIASGEFVPAAGYSDMANNVTPVVASYVNGTTIIARGKVGSVLAAKAASSAFAGVYVGLVVTPGATTGKGYQFGLLRVTGTGADQYVGFRYAGGGAAGTTNKAATNLGADYAPDDIWEIQYAYPGSGSATIKFLLNGVTLTTLTDATPLIVAGDVVCGELSGVGTGTIEEISGGALASATVSAVVADGTGDIPAPTVGVANVNATVTAVPADATGDIPGSFPVSSGVDATPADGTADVPAPAITGTGIGDASVMAPRADATGNVPNPVIGGETSVDLSGVYQWIDNNDPAEHTSQIKLRGGALILKLNGPAEYLTDTEVKLLSSRYTLQLEDGTSPPDAYIGTPLLAVDPMLNGSSMGRIIGHYRIVDELGDSIGFSPIYDTDSADLNDGDVLAWDASSQQWLPTEETGAGDSASTDVKIAATLPRIPRYYGTVINMQDAAMRGDAVTLGAQVGRMEMWAGVAKSGAAAVDEHALYVAAGIKCLPMVNNLGTAWSDSAWEAQAVAAIPFADLNVIEIANEPYGTWFWPTGAHDPAGYGAMVKRCATAVATASGGRVKVLFAAGGTGSTGLDYQDAGDTWHVDTAGSGWINDAVAATPTLLDSIAGVALHPYNIAPGQSGDVLVKGASARLDALGYPNLPLWFTECGQKAATTDSGTSDPATQAARLRTYFRDNLFSTGHPVQTLIWYLHRDYSPIDIHGDNGWGLIDETGTRRPAWYAFRDLAVEFNNARRGFTHNSDHAPGGADPLVPSGDNGQFVVLDSTQPAGYKAANLPTILDALTHFKLTNTPGYQPVFEVWETGDVHSRLYGDAQGILYWGDGASDPDVSLGRSAAQTIRTNGKLASALGITAEAGGMTLRDAAEPASPSNGVTLFSASGVLKAKRPDGTANPVSPFVNVRAFGAKGDGTTDDTAAIQAAINASSPGDTILFPGSTAYLTSAPIIYKGNRQYVGGGSAMSSLGATVKVKNGANLTVPGGVTGVFVSEAWNSNAATGDGPVIFDNLAIDGNAANNAGGQVAGIVMTNFWSRVERCYIHATNLDGVLLAATAKDGTTAMSNLGSENRIVSNHFAAIGRDAVRQRTGTNANFDGFCQHNTVQTCGGTALNFENAGGWHITDNHCYGIAKNGIFADSCYATLIADNYMEDFGGENAATTYYGIWARAFSGRGVTVRDNTVGCVEPATATAFNYIYIEAAPAGSTVQVGVRGNKVKRTSGSDTGRAFPLTINATSGTVFLDGFETNTNPNIGKAPQILGGNFVRRKPTRIGIARPRSGEYLATAPGSTTTTFGTSDLNRVYYMPIEVPEDCDATGLGINVSTALAGTGVTTRLAIFADNGYGERPYAASPLFDMAVDCTSVGAKDVAFTGGNQHFYASRYWAAFAFLGATGATVSTSLILVGCSSTGQLQVGGMSLPALSNSSWRTLFNTVAADLSAVPSAAATPTAVGNNPLIGLKIA